MSNKQSIIDNFQILERYYKQEGDRWRSQAYGGAIKAIQQLNISDIKNINQVTPIININEVFHDVGF